MTYVAASGTARIRHATTGTVYEIEADELDFEAIGADDRNMGLKSIIRRILRIRN